MQEMLPKQLRVVEVCVTFSLVSRLKCAQPEDLCLELVLDLIWECILYNASLQCDSKREMVRVYCSVRALVKTVRS